MLDADHVPLPPCLDGPSATSTTRRATLVQRHMTSRTATRSAPKYQRHEQSLFCRVIAPGKDRHNAMFGVAPRPSCTGTRFEAVGGVLTDTVAEDFHTTIAMHAQGGRPATTTKCSSGASAPDLAGFLLQRAIGGPGRPSASSSRRENPITCRGLTSKRRVSSVSSLFDYSSGLQRLILLLVLIATLASGRLPIRTSLAMLLTLWLPWSCRVLTTLGSVVHPRPARLHPLRARDHGRLPPRHRRLVFRSAGQVRRHAKGRRRRRRLGCSGLGSARRSSATLLIALLLRVCGRRRASHSQRYPKDAIAVILGVWSHCSARWCRSSATVSAAPASAPTSRCGPGSTGRPSASTSSTSRPTARP